MYPLKQMEQLGMIETSSTKTTMYLLVNESVYNFIHLYNIGIFLPSHSSLDKLFLDFTNAFDSKIVNSKIIRKIS